MPDDVELLGALTPAFAALTRLHGVLTKLMKLATCTVFKIIAARQRPQHAGLANLFEAQLLAIFLF